LFSSGLAIGFLGVYWMLMFAIGLTLLTILHLGIAIPEKGIIHAEAQTNHLRKFQNSFQLVPGLFALIFFNCFNNFLGGVFMSLMDAYGLSLVSEISNWGTLWGLLSLGFIVGGLVVAERLGESPLRTLFLANTIMWMLLFSTIQASIVLAIGLFIYLPNSSSRASDKPYPSFRLNVRVACLVLPKHRTAASPLTALWSVRSPNSLPFYDGGWV